MAFFMPAELQTQCEHTIAIYCMKGITLVMKGMNLVMKQFINIVNTDFKDYLDQSLCDRLVCGLTETSQW